MIRIIGGTLRGRKLEVPSGLKVRPSADRVREALFNMLDHRLHWQDFNVLDLYAGSGALGIEALSRGARFATFVECSKTHEKILNKNLLSCKLTRECYDIFLERAERWILSYSDPGNPSLIFLDPPYQENHYLQILKQLADSESIQKGSIIAIESPKKMEFEFQNSLVLMVRKTYGGTALDLLEKQ